MKVRSRTQTFNPGELPLVLLALVESQESTAYELLADLDRLFGPGYQASPGSIYPALKALVAERLLSVRKDGRALRYSLTALGREALGKRRRQLDAICERTAVDVRADGSIRAALQRLEEAVHDSRGTDPTKLAELIDATTDQVLLLTQGEES